MCLIVFSYRQHPNYDLIFAANRDEHYSRPTREAQFWDSSPNILAGKDMKAGGTWMGINKRGEFSALTNYRDPNIEKDNPPSRGHLVLDYLTNGDYPAEYLTKVDSQAHRYQGFNLLAGTSDKLGYYSNQQGKIHFLNEGLYGLSNHLLNTSWPKVKRAKEGLQSVINSTPISEDALFDLLSDTQQAPPSQLPDTGISLELEKKVSPIFIKSEDYGTRCSTILLIRNDGRVTFRERRFKPGSQIIEDENRYEFMIEQ